MIASEGQQTLSQIKSRTIYVFINEVLFEYIRPVLVCICGPAITEELRDGDHLVLKD